MEKLRENSDIIDREISKSFDEIEGEKERKLVNLIIEIIVSVTLKEYYEKGNQVSAFQSIRAK